MTGNIKNEIKDPSTGANVEKYNEEFSKISGGKALLTLKVFEQRSETAYAGDNSINVGNGNKQSVFHEPSQRQS